jgi:hypothetical protein
MNKQRGEWQTKLTSNILQAYGPIWKQLLYCLETRNTAQVTYSRMHNKWKVIELQVTTPTEPQTSFCCVPSCSYVWQVRAHLSSLAWLKYFHQQSFKLINSGFILRGYFTEVSGAFTLLVWYVKNKQTGERLPSILSNGPRSSLAANGGTDSMSCQCVSPQCCSPASQKQLSDGHIRHTCTDTQESSHCGTYLQEQKPWGKQQTWNGPEQQVIVQLHFAKCYSSLAHTQAHSAMHSAIPSHSPLAAILEGWTGVAFVETGRIFPTVIQVERRPSQQSGTGHEGETIRCKFCFCDSLAMSLQTSLTLPKPQLSSSTKSAYYLNDCRRYCREDYIH